MNAPQKTILITGGARRIGRALVEYFAAQGWRVIIHYHHSHKEAKALQTQIMAQNQSCEVIAADLLNEAEVQSLIPTINDRWGKIDCLINNAAAFEYDDINSSTRESWDLHMETNLRAPFVLSQAFAKQTPIPSNACIINILDHCIWNLTPRFMSYTLSKFALWGVTQTMALALAPHIRVNAVGPGPTLVHPRQSDTHFQSFCTHAPLQHCPSLEEICRTTHFIINSLSLTGQMIAVDSGLHLKGSMVHEK